MLPADKSNCGDLKTAWRKNCCHLQAGVVDLQSAMFTRGSLCGGAVVEQRVCVRVCV